MSARFIVPGTLVTKAAQALPATATANLFTVAGGSVLVTGLLGVVTTACGATATTLALGTTPGGTTASIATATAITSAAVGTSLVATSAAGVASALLVAPVPFLSAVPPMFIAPFVLGAGIATSITWTTSATDTGQIKWYLWYVPLDTSATVS